MRPHQVRPFSGHRQWPRHSLSARCFRTVDRSVERHNGRSEYGSNRSGHLTVPVYRGRSECETNRPEASDHLLTIGVENAAGRRVTQPYRHIQGTDGQILFYPIARGPPDYATTEQIDDDSEVEPALGSPDITDISRPFPVGAFSKEITVQKVGRNVRLVVAVGRHLVATGAHGPDPVGLHEAANATFPDIKPGFPEFHGHARPSVGPVAQGKMLTDMRQHLQIGTLALAGRSGCPGPVPPVQRPARPGTASRLAIHADVRG